MSDGRCAGETDIAYVAVFGSAGSNCTRTEPCTFARAHQPGLVERPYVLLDGGTYQLSGTVLIDSHRTFIGRTATRPKILNNNPGPVFRLAYGGNATFDNLEIANARSAPNLFDGYGIDCPMVTTGGRVQILRSVMTGNERGGVQARACTLDIRETTFEGNAAGVEVYDSMTTIDRSMFIGNSGFGASLDGGLFKVTNSFFVRNHIGIDLFPTTTGSVFEFNTIADNTMTGISCQPIQGTQYKLPYNLIVRNGTNINGYENCDLSRSLLIVNDIAPIRFKNPNATPYDYHLTAGSVAAEQISDGTQTRDFDGEVRPSGSAFDYGADELH